MKINNFRGDLTDISAKKEALVEYASLLRVSWSERSFMMQAVWPVTLVIAWAYLSEKWELRPGKKSLEVTNRSRRSSHLELHQLSELKINMTLLYDVLTPMVCSVSFVKLHDLSVPVLRVFADISVGDPEN